MTLRRLPANTLYRLLAIPLVLWLAWQIGIYAGRSGITYVEVIAGALAIAGIIIMGKGQAGIRFGYFAWILTLALGYRTARVGEILRLHPLVILISALCLMLLIYKLGEARGKTRIFIPRWLWVFIFFIGWGFFMALLHGLNIELVLTILMSVGVIVPIVILTYHVIVTENDWARSILAFYAVGTFIAVLGLLEFFVPEIRSILPGFIADVNLGFDQFGFSRAAFSFFGSPVATFICGVALPFVIFLYPRATTAAARLTLLGAAAAMIAAIYVGGYRSLWLTLGIVFVLVFALRRDFARLALLVLIFAVIYFAAPQPGRDRFSSIISAAGGEFVDSSAAKRAHRIEDTISIAIDNPLGVGLSGSGWAHSDLLQITAETGWLGGLVFSLWFLHSLYRLIRLFLQRRAPLDEALLGSMLVVMSILIFQTVMVLPQLSAPVWLIWALVEVRLERVRMTEKAPQAQPIQQFMRPHYFAR
jgi:O-antigen ligase